MFEYQGIFTRLTKYLLEGVAVAIAATILSKRNNSLTIQEIALIALTAALTFFLLDTLAPSIGLSSRTGAGFGLGANMVGFPGPGVMLGGSQDQAGGSQDQATLATGVDATSDAKANPADYSYGAETNPLVSPQPEPIPTLENTKACVIEEGACAAANNGSPLFTQPINNCDCSLNCQPQCQPELSCPINCPQGQTVFPNCNIASNNSPYKIVPGMFSHQIVLPGYNECVKPYNYFETPLGQN
jgi:hypothetical protein